MSEAIDAAPNPLSMFTTETPDAQLLFGRNGDPLYGQARRNCDVCVVTLSILARFHRSVAGTARAFRF